MDSVAGVSAVIGEAVQQSDIGPMIVRFAFFEDGGRLLNLTFTAPELLADPRYKTTIERMNNRDTLVPRLQEIFLTRSYQEWEALLLGNEIPCGAINNIEQLMQHPQVKARGAMHEVQHRTAGTVHVVGSPVRLSATPARVPVPSPTLGEHTRDVMRDVLGLPETEIDKLAASGVFGKPGKGKKS